MSARRFGLRVRVAVVAGAVVGSALTIGGILLVTALRSRLDAVAQDAARARAEDVAALVADGTLPSELSLPGEAAAIVQVIDPAGRVVAATQSADDDPLAPEADDDGPHAHRDSHRRLRVFTTTAERPDGTVLTIYAAESLQDDDDTIGRIATLLLVGMPFLTLLVGGVAWWAVGRSLRPVEAVTNTMAEITATDLHRRVAVPPARDEIGRLASTVNDTLARLDRSTEHQRRFVADASHELRGPLATLKADLEISLVHPRATDWTATANDMLGDVNRLQQLTDDLLDLTRLDGATPLPTASVDLVSVVAGAVARLAPTHIVVRNTTAPTPVVVIGVERQLAQVVDNLLSNAVRHAATTIDAHVAAHGSDAVLTVTDDGPGIPQADRERVLERFVRLDDARTRSTGGTGLGLAIVNEIVIAHRGSITISDADPHGAVVTVTIPA